MHVFFVTDCLFIKLEGTFGEASFLAGRGDRASSAVAVSRVR
jgi:hypothetical protein